MFKKFLVILIRKYLNWKFAVKTFGEFPEKGAILLANHPSFLDGPLILNIYGDEVVTVANEWQFRRLFLGCLLSNSMFIEVPSMFHSKYSKIGRADLIRSAIENCVLAIHLGLKVLIFDNGHLDGDPRCHPGGLWKRIHKEIPDVSVYQMNIFGMKNSEFSWHDRKRPCLWVGLLRSLFKPKRSISIIISKHKEDPLYM